MIKSNSKDEAKIILDGITVDEFLDKVREVVRQELDKLPKPEKIKLYLSLVEVSEMLALSKQTVYTMTHKKQIPYIKRGGKLLFNRAEIIQWLGESAVKAEVNGHEYKQI